MCLTYGLFYAFQNYQVHDTLSYPADGIYGKDNKHLVIQAVESGHSPVELKRYQ